MARKAAHDQRSTPTTFICTHCKLDMCEGCIDVLRKKFGADYELCFCKRKAHNVKVSEAINPNATLETPDGDRRDVGGCDGDIGS